MTKLAVSAALEYLEKTADVITELKPHQQRVVDKLRENNLLIAHGVGSGKTLSSIAAAEALGLPLTVLTPASLVENYKKELAKHHDVPPNDATISSINTATLRNTPIPEGTFLVVDESHGARNADTRKAQYLKEQVRNAQRLALLTGTAVYNDVSDIASAINLLHGDKVVPPTKTDFHKEFVRTHMHEPGFWASMRGVTPGETHSLKNREVLEQLLRGKVDYHEETEGYPSRKDELIHVGMSPSQKRIYQYLEEKLPASLRYKIQNDLPPSKAESQHLNAFVTGMRQVSSSIAPYSTRTSPLEAALDSPKIRRAVEELESTKREKGSLRALSYSNYLDAALRPMQELLKTKGIKSELFHGGLSQKQKKAIVDAYNAGDVEVLLGSSSASEGLDLKGTNVVQLLEPHFNEAKLEQVVGRGVRYQSHAHLPPEEQVVKVQKFLSKLPVDQGWFWNKQTVLNPAVDDYLLNRAKEKQQLMNELVSILRKEGQ